MKIKTAAQLLAFAAFAVTATAATALDPKSVVVFPSAEVKWATNPNGASATLLGDPRKDGDFYVQVIKWRPGASTRPHSHPHDRWITVLEGTYWVGTGPKYDPSSMVPVKAGSWVFHAANGIHFDGVKEDGATIQIAGVGPATTVDREEK
jgi:quercetin dioxygenase-like cupin family protein